MTTLISIDPGMSTGVVVGTFSDTEPFKLEFATQIEGGVQGFTKEVSNQYCTDSFSDTYGETCFSVGRFSNGGFYHWYDEVDEDTIFIAEKFTARGTGNGFAYRTEALEPLRVEGAMIAMEMNLSWCSPAQQYFAGGKGPEAKKRAHAWLKAHDLYISPKSVGCKDADDARSALLHAIAYLRRIGHEPTIRHYFPTKGEG